MGSLAAVYPKLAKEWHPIKNGDLTPDKVKTNSDKIVWWYFPYDDPKTGKHFDFEWEASVISRGYGKSGCPFTSNRAAWKGFNDLETFFPEIAAEWHPTKNGNLKPSDVVYSSDKKAWWLLPYDDPKTGKHFDFEWEAVISHRTYDKTGCPYIRNRAVWKGYNDLEAVYPEIAAEWHPTKNGDLKPSEVVYTSHKKVWWLLPYDDPKTGKHFDFEWEANIIERTSGKTGCPHIKNRAVMKGFNDLETLYPEIAAEWHPVKNGDLKPSEVVYASNKKVWWLLPYDDPKTGKHFDFEWETKIKNRTNGDSGCPYLSNRAVWKGYNDLETVCPEIAAEWHPTRNGDLKPSDITYISNKKVWWFLPYDDPKTGKHFDFEWEAMPSLQRRADTRCPYLSGHSVLKGFNDLATTHPYILKEWDYENNTVSPTEISFGSSVYAWWKCSFCNESYRMSVCSKCRGSNCPNCVGLRGIFTDVL